MPRHIFVPEAFQHQAYSENVSISIGEGQTISQPCIVAMMTEAAAIRPDEKVLEIGTGSGYQAAVLAQLARFVFSVERIGSLARSAKAKIDSLGLENVSVKMMDGTLGWRAQAPYSAIIVTAGAPAVPEPLFEQLAEGGRLVLPIALVVIFGLVYLKDRARGGYQVEKLHDPVEPYDVSGDGQRFLVNVVVRERRYEPITA